MGFAELADGIDVTVGDRHAWAAVVRSAHPATAGWIPVTVARVRVPLFRRSIPCADVGRSSITRIGAWARSHPMESGFPSAGGWL
jgi:hypothetical protein